MSINLVGQDISERYPELIEIINQINEDNLLDTVILVNEEFLPQMTDGGGELTGYFKNDKIHKITRRVGISYGIECYDYYFHNEKLIFIYETFEGFLYNENQETFDYTKTETNFIGRYYFKDNNLIDLETTGHNKFENDEIDIQYTLIKETEDNLKKLKQKKK